MSKIVVPNTCATARSKSARQNPPTARSHETWDDLDDVPEMEVLLAKHQKNMRLEEEQNGNKALGHGHGMNIADVALSVGKTGVSVAGGTVDAMSGVAMSVGKTGLNVALGTAEATARMLTMGMQMGIKTPLVTASATAAPTLGPAADTKKDPRPLGSKALPKRPPGDPNKSQVDKPSVAPLLSPGTCRPPTRTYALSSPEVDLVANPALLLTSPSNPARSGSKRSNTKAAAAGRALLQGATTVSNSPAPPPSSFQNTKNSSAPSLTSLARSTLSHSSVSDSSDDSSVSSRHHRRSGRQHQSPKKDSLRSFGSNGALANLIFSVQKVSESSMERNSRRKKPSLGRSVSPSRNSLSDSNHKNSFHSSTHSTASSRHRSESPTSKNPIRTAKSGEARHSHRLQSKPSSRKSASQLPRQNKNNSTSDLLLALSPPNQSEHRRGRIRKGNSFPERVINSKDETIIVQEATPVEPNSTKKANQKRDTNHHVDTFSSDEEPVTMALMMKMLQDLQKEVVALRQEVSLLKAERVASTKSGEL